MTPTQRIGPYEVVSRIGQGGMGEVWRATDTNLGRDVAIKVLPPEFSNDPDRLARFEREARALAALNHTSIASIYGFEQGCLIMEYVAGPGLDEVLRRGPVELDEALRLARQLTEALEAAHGKGIVHRDLKPANLKLTADGKLKVLDFGLAKALAGELAASASVSQSPTLTVGTTKAGVLLGTAAYMSPEQARGKTVDKRADIWAFGCIVYEMLTGRQTFAGDTVADILGAVVRAEPAWSLLPPSTPASVRRMLRRCLEKDPDKRLRDIGDAALELTEPPEAPVVVTRRKASLWIAGGAVAAAGAAAGYFARGRNSEPTELPRAVQRFRVPIGDPPQFGRVRIARTGERFFYIARPRNAVRANRSIVSCDLDGSAPKPIGDALQNSNFAPSPDGKLVAFVSQAGLVRAAASGGDPQLITKRDWRADYWTDDGLLLAQDTKTIVGIAVRDGEARVLARLSEEGAVYGTAVRMLPGGTHLLVVAYRDRQPSVAVQDLKGGPPGILAERASSPMYIRSGHLLYRRDSNWQLLPFDLRSMHPAGPEVQVPAGELRNNVDVDDAGTLVTASAEAPLDDLRILNSDGSMTRPFALNRSFRGVHASPDGTAVLLAGGGDGNVWRLDFVRGVQTRMTFAERGDETPVWSSDGTQFAWLNATANESAISVRPADGSGTERVLYRNKSHDHVESWSPDGRFLLITESNPSSSGIYVVSVATGERRPWFETRFNHRHAVFSPDGRWVAYTSDESGRNEVYVRPFPGPGGKWQVSTDGGGRPRWSRDGKLIYYTAAAASLMAVPVQTANEGFTAGTPRKVLELSLGDYDVLPGGRFIAFTTTQSDTYDVLVTTNFFERARQLAPRSS